MSKWGFARREFAEGARATAVALAFLFCVLWAAGLWDEFTAWLNLWIS